MAKYEDYQVQLMPPWLQGTKGRSFNESLGAVKDTLLEYLVTALSAAAIRYAGEEALYYIGKERGMGRAPGEALEAYRARLLAAWDFWRWAGTVKGMTMALEAAGYEVRIVEHYKTNMAIWAQFSVYLRSIKPEFTASKWGEGVLWGSGDLWSGSLGGLEPARIMTIIQETKAAHAKPRNVYYFTSEYNYWGNGILWGTNATWGANLFQIL